MDWKDRAAAVASLASALKQRGSWCGETHIQKAVYFLQEMTDIGLDYDFVLYKHGPFSFDLRDDLALFRSRKVMGVQPQPAPYGPSYEVTDTGESIIEASQVASIHEGGIGYIAAKLGGLGVVALERLATALLVAREEGTDTPLDVRANRLTELKPHVPFEAALSATQAIDQMLGEIEAADQEGEN